MLESKYFGYREQLPAHTLALINSVQYKDNLVSVYHDLDTVIQAVFNEQPTTFGSSERSMEALVELARNVRPISWVPTLFYRNNLIVTPEIRRGGLTGTMLHQDTEKNIIELSNILFSPEVSRSQTGSNHNQTYFISGNIGVGKSAMIKQILSSDKLYNWVKEQRGWFLRINIQDFVNTNPFTSLTIYKLIFDRLTALCESMHSNSSFAFILDPYRAQLSVFRNTLLQALAAGDKVQCETTILDALRFAQKSMFNGKMVLIFDNVDYIFYATDEALGPANEAYNWVGKPQEQELIFSFIEFVSKISYHDTNWLHLGATILYVIRNEGVDLIRQALTKRDGGDISIPDPTSHFVVSDPAPQQTQQILRSRLRLLLGAMHILLVNELNSYFEATFPDLRLPLPEFSAEAGDHGGKLGRALAFARDLLGKARLEAGQLTAEDRRVAARLSRIEAVYRDATALEAALSAAIENRADDHRTIRSAKAVTELLSLSSTGMRGALAAYQTFAWVNNEYKASDALLSQLRAPLPREGRAVIQMDRVMRSPTLPLMVHMLNGLVRYSERETKFPNIFRAHLPQYHESEPRLTYPDFWLIPCLMKYVDHYKYPAILSAFDIFCAPKKPHETRPPYASSESGVYEPSPLRRLLWRLQSINNGSRIFRLQGEVDFLRRQMRYTRMELTERGQRLLRSTMDDDRGPLAIDYRYLQLVIDDYELPLPPETYLARDRSQMLGAVARYDDVPAFRYIDEFGYDYIVKQTYSTTYNKILQHKLIKLARFLGILRAAQDAERKKYWLTWQRLEEEIDLSGWIFNLREALSGIIDDAFAYSRDVRNFPTKEDIIREFENYASRYRDPFHAYYRKSP